MLFHVFKLPSYQIELRNPQDSILKTKKKIMIKVGLINNIIFCIIGEKVMFCVV